MDGKSPWHWFRVFQFTPYARSRKSRRYAKSVVRPRDGFRMENVDRKPNAAREKSAHFAWFMASLATSGGEGAALSRERDQFLASLRPDPEVAK